MSIVLEHRYRRYATWALALGVATFTASIIAGAFEATYEGVGIFDDRTLGLAVLSFILLIATAVMFGLSTRASPPRRATLGLVLAMSGGPVTSLLLIATYTILNDVLHIYR